MTTEARGNVHGGERVDIPAPPVAGIGFRHYSGPSDIPGMVAVANASYTFDEMELVVTADSLEAHYATPVNWDPFQDVLIAEVNGRMVGYTRGWRKREVGGSALHIQMGVLHPDWRGRGIGSAMLAWLEQRQRAVAALLEPGAAGLFNVYVTQHEVGRVALLERAGYRVARYFFSMVRPHLDDIPDFELPDGIELRPVRKEHLRAIWEADLEAMNDHWGRTQPSESDYQAWLSHPDSIEPSFWRVAWDVSSNRVVGQVRAFVSVEENRVHRRARGYTEFISVREPWRKRGIARALIVDSLRGQRAAGLAESALEVDSAHPAGATHIYEACGFEVVKRNMVYRKPI